MRNIAHAVPANEIITEPAPVVFLAREPAARAYPATFIHWVANDAGSIGGGLVPISHFLRCILDVEENNPGHMQFVCFAPDMAAILDELLMQWQLHYGIVGGRA